MKAIETEALIKRYRDGDSMRAVVDGVSLGIQAGSLVVIEGPSGSGKTTLLALMGGMVVPSAGEVRIEGRSIVHLRDAHRTGLRREKIGFVFQELALVPDMTVIENVLLPLVPTGGASAGDRARAGGLLERFGISGRANARAGQLSGGERQRAAVARALVRDPPIVLLDEPTAHLDAQNARSMIEALRGLRDEGRTVVCASHDPRLDAEPAIDQRIVMEAGRVVT